METPVSNLLDQLNVICDQGLDDIDANRENLQKHAMKPALFEVLCEIKAKTALSVRNGKENVKDDSNLVRVDNFLLAEGVVGGPLGDCDDQSDYGKQLVDIRKQYNDKITFISSIRSEFDTNLRKLLQDQSRARPISTKEIDDKACSVQDRFSDIEMHIKNAICEDVMQLKSRLLDARRKRRNFSKQATELLNAYFHAHIDNPYPSEETKEELARQCNISVSQVSNWFGNKRIRYKKNIPKAQVEANAYAAKMAGVAPFGLVNPYQLPGSDFAMAFDPRTDPRYSMLGYNPNIKFE